MTTPRYVRSLLLIVFTLTMFSRFSATTCAYDRSTLGNATKHLASSMPVRSIDQVYAEHHADLGTRIGPIVSVKFYANYQVCANGIIISHDLGAFEFHGPIYQKFLRLGRTRPGKTAAETFLRERIDKIGFPMTDTMSYSGRGLYSFFARGAIYYFPTEATDLDPASGAFVLAGEFYDKWISLGSALGAPLSDRQEIVRCAPEEIRDHDCGSYQHFDRGVIYERPGLGVMSVVGDMYRYWTRAMRGLDHDADFGSYTLSDPRAVGWSVTDGEGNSILGFPTGDETSAADGSAQQEFSFGSIQKRTIAVPSLRFFSQNIALIPSIYYKGTERERAINALIDYLRRTPYDVVGISEAWDVKAALPRLFLSAERDVKGRFIRALRDIYPYYMTGPDEEDMEADGGLLLLSRYPIVQQHQTIFRQCSGVDCFANKGVLHARLQTPGFAPGYDIFISHTQNPADRELSQQFSHLSSFVRAYSSPDRPAILLGDLNVNGLTRPLGATPYYDMRRKLNFPDDVWLTNYGSLPGITFDQNGVFSADHYPIAPDSRRRHIAGERLDYFLSWPGLKFLPQFTNSQVVLIPSSSDRDGRVRDVSDHYGIRTEISRMPEFTVTVRRPIASVTVELAGFRCLQVTEGFSDATRRANDDEPYFELRLRPALGDRPRPNRVGITEGVNNGTVHSYYGVSLTVPDPGEYLDVVVSGWEHDDIVSDNTLGDQEIHLTRADLLSAVGGSLTRVLPLFTGDDGEYSVTVRITVNSTVAR